MIINFFLKKRRIYPFCRFGNDPDLLGNKSLFIYYFFKISLFFYFLFFDSFFLFPFEMSNHSSTNNATLEDSNPRLLHLYNNKSNEGGLPTLKKSISRSTLLNSSLSPTRPLFNKPSLLTLENAVYPENQPQHDSTVTKRSHSTPVATVKSFVLVFFFAFYFKIITNKIFFLLIG